MDEDKITSQDGEQITIRRNLLVHFEFLEPLKRENGIVNPGWKIPWMEKEWKGRGSIE